MITLPPIPSLLSKQNESCTVDVSIKLRPSLHKRLVKLKDDGRAREVNTYLREVIEAAINALEQSLDSQGV
jgi:predicted DNA-binding protein